MALITDPDNLSQGAVTAATGVTFGTPTGSQLTISGTGLPGLAAGDYFEIRNANSAQNNGLWVESGGSPTTSSITATKVAGDNGATPVADAVSSATTFLHDDDTVDEEKSVYFDFYNREIWLLKQGSLSADGATLQAIYSFSKEEWKNDSQLIPHPFPFVAITPEQFELVENWVFHTGVSGSPVQDTETRKLIRTGGWREIGADDVIDQEWVGVITLGTFEDNANDTAYFQQGNDPTDTSAAVNFTFAGPVNEAIRSYNYVTTGPFSAEIAITGSNTITRSDGGSWITDGYLKGGKITIVSSDQPGNVGTWTISSLTSTVLVVTGTPLTNDADDLTFTSAVNNRNILNLFLRIRDGDTNGKTYSAATLPDIGVSEVDNKVFRFPLSNATDLKISATDATISGNSPYNQIAIRYFDQAFTKDVDGVAPRSFGIVIDVGTLSGVDGVSNGTTTFTTAEAGIPGTTYDGGTLTIHEGVDAGIHTIVSASGGSITLGSALTGSENNLSFTLQRATPVSATAEQIYEKVQYFLRQASDIDSTDQTVVGNTSSGLLRFVGDTLEAGQSIPTNPNGGGSGVIIEGFSSNDTNRLTFYDNSAVARTYPFVAAGSITFNANLQNDAQSYYWMFYQYTVRTIPTNAVTATASGRNVTFTTTSGAVNLPVVVAGQYIAVNNFPEASKVNGIYRITTYTDQTTGGFVGYKVSVPDGNPITTASSGADANFDENPIDSPDALIVQNNSGTDIKGLISAQSSVSFDYDYDNNAQGERVAGQGSAAVIIRAIGFDTAQFVETTGTITRNTGLNFSLVASLERNYSNAA